MPLPEGCQLSEKIRQITVLPHFVPVHPAHGIVAGIGVIIALFMPNIITALQIFYSLMSVSLAAPFLCGLFSRRASAKGAFASALGGVSTVFYLQVFNAGKGIWLLNVSSTGIVVSVVIMLISMYVVPNKSILDDGMRNFK